VPLSFRMLLYMHHDLHICCSEETACSFKTKLEKY
jgi:hypothetical protein